MNLDRSPLESPIASLLLYHHLQTTCNHTFHLQLPVRQESLQRQSTMATEQTFIMVKPDGVQRGLSGEIIKRFEQRGYQLVACKLTHASVEHLEEHYADLKGKGFFPGLIKYMNSGPVLAMVWQGKDVVKQGRVILGATNPLASAPGTIRGDFAIDVGRNVCHGSDAVESAQKEIALWFGKQDATVSYEPRPWLYE